MHALGHFRDCNQEKYYICPTTILIYTLAALCIAVLCTCMISDIDIYI